MTPLMKRLDWCITNGKQVIMTLPDGTFIKTKQDAEQAAFWAPGSWRIVPIKSYPDSTIRTFVINTEHWRDLAEKELEELLAA